jgi:hypothetical protein
MDAASTNEVTQVLIAWGNGDSDALDKLIPLVYQELDLFKFPKKKQSRQFRIVAGGFSFA